MCTTYIVTNHGRSARVGYDPHRFGRLQPYRLLCERMREDGRWQFHYHTFYSRMGMATAAADAYADNGLLPL